MLHYKTKSQSPYRYDIISTMRLSTTKRKGCVCAPFQNRNDETVACAVYEFWSFTEVKPDRAIGIFIYDEQDFPVEIKTELYVLYLPLQMIEAFLP